MICWSDQQVNTGAEIVALACSEDRCGGAVSVGALSFRVDKELADGLVNHAEGRNALGP